MDTTHLLQLQPHQTKALRALYSKLRRLEYAVRGGLPKKHYHEVCEENYESHNVYFHPSDVEVCFEKTYTLREFKTALLDRWR